MRLGISSIESEAIEQCFLFILNVRFKVLNIAQTLEVTLLQVYMEGILEFLKQLHGNDSKKQCALPTAVSAGHTDSQQLHSVTDETCRKGLGSVILHR